MTILALYLSLYGGVALSHIAIQMLLGHLEHRRQSRCSYAGDTPSVTVVVPAYNEGPALLHRCLLSINRQDYPQIDVVVVDDGSHNVHEALPVHEEFGTGRFRVILRADNTGKRNCQGVVFDEAESDIVVTIDSDTVLAPDAIRTIVRRFADPRVGAVTGNVEVINKKNNLLTRLIAYRYWSAFNQERAAQSLFGVVMCASGPFSAYRRTVIDEVKHGYVNQMFLGQQCTFGDDRHLTNLVLDRGYRVVYDEAAVARTLVPTNIRSYLRQQVRWNKSFYREILWTARFAHRRHPYLGIDLLLQTVMPFALLGALGLTVYSAFADPSTLWRYGAVIAAIGLVRSVYGVLRTRSAGFLLFVVYGFLHVTLLIPTRLYALSTLKRSHWGTRGGGIPDEQERERRETVRARSPEGVSEALVEWERDIRATVEQGDEFELYWQPVRRLSTGALEHAEALLRLRHRGQVLLPREFLGIAARRRLMTMVDAWVVWAAAVQLAGHAAEGETLTLEVNVSAQSVGSAAFVEVVRRELADAGVAPARLVLEIPESVALQDPAAAAVFANRVRGLGCRFALDRFGDTAVASVDDHLRLLEDLRPDFVKLHGSLIRPLAYSRTARARLVQLLAGVRPLGVDPIAMFVGDEATIEILEAAGVDHVQGFHVGTPHSVDVPLATIVDKALSDRLVLA